MPKLKVDLIVDDQGSQTVTKFTAHTEQSMLTAGRAAAALAAGISAIATAGVVREFVQLADTSTLLHGRLNLVGGDFEKIYNLAAQTRQGLEPTVELYTRMARATEELNLSEERLLAITESLNKAVIVSGSTQAEASAALVQLSQGMASGVLRGEELNSVMEQTPRIARMIADGLGITIGELRAMGKEGEITTGKLISALESGAQSVDEEFAKIPKTVGQSMTVLGNAALKTVGEIDSMAGSTDRLTSSLEMLVDVVEVVPHYFAVFMRQMTALEMRFVQGIIKIQEWALAYQQGVLKISETVESIPLLGDYLVPDADVARTKGRIADITTSIEVWRQVLAEYNRDYVQYNYTTEYGAEMLERTTAAGDQNSKVIKKQGEETEKAKQKTIDYLKVQQELSLAVLPKQEQAVERVWRQYEQLEDQLWSLYEVGKISDETAEEWMDALGDRQTEALAALEQGHEETATEVTNIWEHAFENIQGALVDMIYDFEFSFDSILDMGRRFASQYAAAMIMTPVQNMLMPGQGGMTQGQLGIYGPTQTGGNLSTMPVTGMGFGGFGSLFSNQALGGLQIGTAEFFSDTLEMTGIGDYIIDGLSAEMFGSLTAGFGTFAMSLLSGKDFEQAAGGGIGAGAGFYLGGPLGALAGGLLGDWLGGMLGGGDPDWASVAIANERMAYDPFSQSLTTRPTRRTEGDLTSGYWKARTDNVWVHGDEADQAFIDNMDAAVKAMVDSWDNLGDQILDVVGESWMLENPLNIDLPGNESQRLKNEGRIDNWFTAINEGFYDDYVPALQQALTVLSDDVVTTMADLPISDAVRASIQDIINTSVGTSAGLGEMSAEKGLEAFALSADQLKGVKAYLKIVGDSIDTIIGSWSGTLDRSKMSAAELSVQSLNTWYREQEKIAYGLGEGLNILNEAYQEQLFDIFEPAISILDDYKNGVVDHTNSLFQQQEAVFDLIAAYDGGIDSTFALADAVGILGDMQIKTLADIHNAMASVDTSMYGARETIRLDVMSDKEKYDYYQGKSMGFGANIQNAMSPEEVLEYLGLAKGSALSAWGLLDEGQKESYIGGFETFFTGIEDLALTALERLGLAVTEGQAATKAALGAIATPEQDFKDSTIVFDSSVNVFDAAIKRLEVKIDAINTTFSKPIQVENTVVIASPEGAY